MHKELIEILPEFELIKDDDLRLQCLQVWDEVMTTGGWSMEDLEQIPFTLLIPNCSVGFREHVQAVTQVAIKTAEVLSQFYSQYYSLNMDTIVAGALLHDIGKLLEYRREGKCFIKSESGHLLRHPFSGAGLAMKHDLPAEVVHIIAAHAKEGDFSYRSPEAVIVHHADFMNFEPLHNI